MTSLTLAAVLQASIAVVGAEPFDSYAEAHREAQQTGKPIVVMVGATWCSPCRKMKKTVLPLCEKRGLLRRVAFAVVDLDQQKKLARKVIRSGPVPQLVMYRRAADGWKREKLVGGQSVASVEKFIENGLAAHDVALKATAKKDAEAKRQAASSVDKKPISNG